MKILIAEDDMDNVGLVECILKNSGHTVEVVCDNVETLERLRYAQFDVFLEDLLMSQMNVVTLTQKVRDEREIASLILIITAVEVNDTHQQILQAVADEFLIKSYEAADLVQVLSDGFFRFTQPKPEVSVVKPVRMKGLPPIVGVAIAPGTENPMNISKLFYSVSRLPGCLFRRLKWSGIDDGSP